MPDEYFCFKWWSGCIVSPCFAAPHAQTNQSKSTENIKIYVYLIHTSCHNWISCAFACRFPHQVPILQSFNWRIVISPFSLSSCSCHPFFIFSRSFSFLLVSLFSTTDSAFTERILGLPNENFKGYVEADATQRARHIPSHSYFLLHGLADSSVPYLHGTQLARALAKAGIIFQYQVSICRDLNKIGSISHHIASYPLHHLTKAILLSTFLRSCNGLNRFDLIWFCSISYSSSSSSSSSLLFSAPLVSFQQWEWILNLFFVYFYTYFLFSSFLFRFRFTYRFYNANRRMLMRVTSWRTFWSTCTNRWNTIWKTAWA